MSRLLTLVSLVAAATVALGAPVEVSLTPTADAFVRSLAPNSNYGLAGGLSVSGSAAVNGSGAQMGLLDTFMRFDVSGFVAAADAEFGSGGWELVAATLALTEQGAPNNPIFNRGIGRLEVRWLAADAWAEGTGTPNSPTTDGVSFSSEPSLLSPGLDEMLGLSSNTGADGPLAFTLGLADGFVQDVLAGGEVSLFLTAYDDTVGFTFNSRNITGGRPLPLLVLVADAAQGAIPEPASAALLALGLCAAACRTRRRKA